ncbi:MAG TPA: hypothetical protein VNS49_26360, partial [Streptomyces sp.]|nr:hypothetical protein [Streptomyces sp.]
YRISASLDEYRGDKFTLIEADTATGVTARTLGEIGAELERLSADPPSQEEVDSAREFLIGVTAMSAASQKGMAELLINALENDSGPEWLQGQVQAVRNVTRADVMQVVGEFYETARFAGVVVGDETSESAWTFG